VPDLKESLEIGREGEEGLPNMWPSCFDDEGQVFKDVMLEFFDCCKDLHMQVMRAVAMGLGIEEAWFDGFTDGGDNTLRLLHYPEVKREVFRRKDGLEQVRAGEHTDYGACKKGVDDEVTGRIIRELANEEDRVNNFAIPR